MDDNAKFCTHCGKSNDESLSKDKARANSDPGKRKIVLILSLLVLVLLVGGYYFISSHNINLTNSQSVSTEQPTEIVKNLISDLNSPSTSLQHAISYFDIDSKDNSKSKNDGITEFRANYKKAKGNSSNQDLLVLIFSEMFPHYFNSNKKIDLIKVENPSINGDYAEVTATLGNSTMGMYNPKFKFKKLSSGWKIVDIK